MSLEIRAARADEMEEFTRVTSTALVEPEGRWRGPAEWTLCAFDNGRLTSGMAAWPFVMSFNGRDAPVAGVAHVGTLPVYRRHGYLRQIMTAYFKLLYEQGERPLAILHAIRSAVYQRYGYATTCSTNIYKLESRLIEFALPRPTPGTFRELGEDDFRLLDALYQKFRAERTGYLRRGHGMWKWGSNALRRPPKNTVLGMVAYEEDGKLLGYIIYHQGSQEPSDDTPRGELTIRDLVWLTPAAYRMAWEYLLTCMDADTIRWQNVPPDDPLPHLLLEPRVLNVTSGDGIMARVVDVKRALTLRLYPVAGTLTFEILDELCPWNRGCWQLETSSAEASIQRTNASPQLRMPVSTLAMIIFNQISATEAARMGRLDALEPGALPLWDTVMRTAYRPFCADRF